MASKAKTIFWCYDSGKNNLHSENIHTHTHTQAKRKREREGAAGLQKIKPQAKTK